MALVLGESFSEAVPIGTSGLTFTRDASYISGVSTLWNPTIAEIGGTGSYLFTYTPAVAGTFVWVATSSGGDDVTLNFDVEAVAATTVVVAAAATGALTVTRAELRDEIADQFEDLVVLAATANGNVGKTTLIDSYHVNDGTEHFNGRDLLCTSGTNAGLIRRVIGTAKSSGTVTLNAALTVATATDDTFKVYNRSGRGFAVEQYNREINYAIRNAFPTGAINVVATITGAFDANSPEITIPSSLVEVNALEAQDSAGFWHAIPQARARGGAGWFADGASGQLRLHGLNAWFANTLSLRVFGLGRQPELTADTDVCALSNKFIVAHASYRLSLAGVANEQNSVRVNLFRDEMERYRTTLRRFPDGARAKVRAT